MCLIIVNPAGIALPEEHLDNGWTRNNDSAGYMFVLNGQLVIRKPFYELAMMRESLLADRKSAPESPFVIHFRYATHGGSNGENCHPHSLCGGSVGLAHNGVLHDFLPPYGADYSDTVHFCRTVLTYRRAGDMMSETFRSILASMIGDDNKLVLLRDTAELSIVNEARGIWDSGNWYSNSGYKPASPKLKTFNRGLLFGDSFASQSWDDLTDSEWRQAKADEQVMEDAESELEALDAMIDAEGWYGLTATEQDGYLTAYEKVYGPVSH